MFSISHLCFPLFGFIVLYTLSMQWKKWLLSATGSQGPYNLRTQKKRVLLSLSELLSTSEKELCLILFGSHAHLWTQLSPDTRITGLSYLPTMCQERQASCLTARKKSYGIEVSGRSLIHSFTHSFIQQIFIEHPLCAQGIVLTAPVGMINR